MAATVPALAPPGAISTPPGRQGFQHAGREASVQLQLSLGDGTTGEALGTASVPFLVQR